MADTEPSGCTCGMELGRKLASIQHLLSSAPTLSKGSDTIRIDLTSSSPWSSVGASDYFELDLRYGPENKEGLKVQVDAQGKRFRLGGRDGEMARLQAEVEQTQLKRMIEDAMKTASPELKGTLEQLLAVGMSGKPGQDRGKYHIGDRHALGAKIDASAARWFTELGGLTEEELGARLDKARSADPLDAREDLEALADMIPESLVVKRELAALYVHAFSDFKLKEAARMLEGVRKALPNDHLTEELYGDAQLKVGDLEEAKKSYTHAHELSRGQSPWALFGLGQLAELAGDHGEARQFYVRAGRQTRDPALRRCLEQLDARLSAKLRKTN